MCTWFYGAPATELCVLFLRNCAQNMGHKPLLPPGLKRLAESNPSASDPHITILIKRVKLQESPGYISSFKYTFKFSLLN